MLRLSGFGQSGPLAQQPGFGAIGESMGGLRYVTGFPDRPPVKTGISIGDSIAALWGVIGTLLALRHKEQNGGQGQEVDVALYESVFAIMESLLPEFDVFGFVRERSGNIMPGITPSNTHSTQDGKHAVSYTHLDVDKRQVERRVQDLNLRVRFRLRPLTKALLGAAHDEADVAIEILEGALPAEIDDDLPDGVEQAVLRGVVAAIGRRRRLNVFGRHRRASEDVVVVEVGTVQDLRAHRVEKGLGKFGLLVVDQVANVCLLYTSRCV